MSRQIGAVNESIAKQVDLVNSMESQLVESHKKLYQLDMEKNTRENQIRMYHERITELDARSRRTPSGEERHAGSWRSWTRRATRQTAVRTLSRALRRRKATSAGSSRI